MICYICRTSHKPTIKNFPQKIDKVILNKPTLQGYICKACFKKGRRPNETGCS